MDGLNKIGQNKHREHNIDLQFYFTWYDISDMAEKKINQICLPSLRQMNRIYSLIENV